MIKDKEWIEFEEWCRERWAYFTPVKEDVETFLKFRKWKRAKERERRKRS